MNAKQLCQQYGMHWKKAGFASWNQKVTDEDKQKVKNMASAVRAELVKLTRQQRNPR